MATDASNRWAQAMELYIMVGVDSKEEADRVFNGPPAAKEMAMADQPGRLLRQLLGQVGVAGWWTTPIRKRNEGRQKDASTDLWSSKNPPAKDVEAFIAASPEEAQPKLRELRRITGPWRPRRKRSSVIGCRRISLTATLVGFAGFKHHIGFYPMSGSFLDDYKKELRGYVTTKAGYSSLWLNPFPWRSSSG